MKIPFQLPTPDTNQKGKIVYERYFEKLKVGEKAIELSKKVNLRPLQNPLLVVILKI